MKLIIRRALIGLLLLGTSNVVWAVDIYTVECAHGPLVGNQVGPNPTMHFGFTSPSGPYYFVRGDTTFTPQGNTVTQQAPFWTNVPNPLLLLNWAYNNYADNYQSHANTRLELWVYNGYFYHVIPLDTDQCVWGSWDWVPKFINFPV